MSKTITVTLNASGKKIQVYKSMLRATWINFEDCKTEYTKKELTF